MLDVRPYERSADQASRLTSVRSFLMASAPTPEELREMLVTMLAGAAGGSEDRWRQVVGSVAKRSLMQSIQTNWSIEPRGSNDELEVVERAVEIVRSAYPYAG